MNLRELVYLVTRKRAHFLSYSAELTGARGLEDMATDLHLGGRTILKITMPEAEASSKSRDSVLQYAGFLTAGLRFDPQFCRGRGPWSCLEPGPMCPTVQFRHRISHLPKMLALQTLKVKPVEQIYNTRY
jgi:hypothetical protein